MGNVYAVVMAGGRGERFWPLSTERLPKPFIPLLGPRSLIQQTVDRLEPLIPAERIFVAIGKSHDTIAREQLPQLPPENFIIEPVGRDTSACLGFSALHLERREADAIMLALPADHFVADPHAYRGVLRRGIENLKNATAVVFGIVPVRPDTSYGYVQAEKPAVPAGAWPVLRFVEKPDASAAARYLAAGNFFWNSGIFLWHNRVLLELFARHMPATCEGLNRLRELLGRSTAEADIHRVFSGLQRVSIDFGILEKCSGLRLIPADFGWDDIGNWASLERVLPPDDGQNIGVGAYAAVESNGCIVYSDSGTVATFGVSGLVVVQAHGKVLICRKERAADLKQLVSVLEQGDRA